MLIPVTVVLLITSEIINNTEIVYILGGHKSSKYFFSNIVWNYFLLIWTRSCVTGNNLYFRQGYDIKINSFYLRNVPLPLPGGENTLSLRTSNSAIGLNKDSEATSSPSAITGLYCTVSSLLDPSVREFALPKKV